MSALARMLRAGLPVGDAQSLYANAAVQSRLLLLLAINLAAVAASFSIENLLLPWQSRMDATTPGWCFVLAQASTIGLVAALAIRGGWLAVVEAILAATLLGYAYVLAGSSLIDPRRAIQQAHLIFRAVELGMIVVAAMACGIGARLMLHQRLLVGSNTDAIEHGWGSQQCHRRQYHVGELLFLMAVFAVGLGLVNLFFDHFDRETQLAEIVLAVLRAFPAALPWLWGVTQPKLSPAALAAIVAITIAVMLLKVTIAYTLTGDELTAILMLAVRRAAAYAAGATLNGLALRGLGFRWQAA
jgi:hypothetical protein